MRKVYKVKTEFERKTVFLYPETESMQYEQLLATHELVTNVNLIVYSANDLIKSILTSGNFSFINCLPSVSMQSISEDKQSFKDCNNVRICISGFNEIDYTDNYSNIISQYQRDCSDISHLVAVHITEKASKPKFSIDSKNNFDVIIESSLEHLENVLVAIMLDISLYHYFLLSDDLQKRKMFNKLKFDYLCSNTSQQEQTKIYGAKLDPNSPIYLPFSLKSVMKLSARSKKETRSEAIEELVNEYAYFLAETVSYKILINERGSILNPVEHTELKNRSLIEDTIQKNIKYNKYLILIPENLTETATPIVVEFNTDGGIVSWMNKELETSTSYQIIKVFKKGI